MTILQGLKRGARKALSIAKHSEVIQRDSESLSEFCERLYKAYNTPTDPARAAGSQMVVNVAYMSLAYPENVR